MENKTYYEKELDTKNEVKTNEFIEAVDKIMAETTSLRANKAKSLADIPPIKEQMAIMFTDVETIMNDEGRKKVMVKKRELEEQISELELFSKMDVEAYQKNKLNELYSLGNEAFDEYQAFCDKVDVLYNQVEEEAASRKQELMKLKNASHPYKRAERTHDEMKKFKSTQLA